MQRPTGEVEVVAQKGVHELSDRGAGTALQADESPAGVGIDADRVRTTVHIESPY
jgi:hypothetical protein